MIGRECADSYSTPKQVIYDSNLISLWGQKKKKKVRTAATPENFSGSGYRQPLR